MILLEVEEEERDLEALLVSPSLNALLVEAVVHGLVHVFVVAAQHEHLPLLSSSSHSSYLVRISQLECQKQQEDLGALRLLFGLR